MRRLLLFVLMCVCVSIGAWAAGFPWTSSDGQYTVTASNVEVGGSNTYQKLVVNKAGALAAFVAATKDLSDSEGGSLIGVGGNSTRVNLQIEGALNSDDFSALNSTEVARWGTFTSLDLKNATIEDMSVITSSSMSMGNLKYMRLSPNLTDVNAMESLKTRNASLDLVLSVGDLDTTLPKIYINSFTPNSIVEASDVFKNGYNGFEDLKACKYVTMTGNYGDTDLVNGTSNNFGNAAVWDFTGATFTECTLPTAFTFSVASESGDKNHYDINDPFKEKPSLAITELPVGYQTNAFYYFKNMAPHVVDIKLPDGITTLPPGCLGDLGSQNKSNYMLINGLTSQQFEDQFGYTDQNGQTQVPEFATIESLVIPESYVYLDHECAYRARIRHLVIGRNVKEIRGGAFGNSTTLEDLDFASGINNLKIGTLAFGECKSMKHIALSEGIYSIGSNAFSNSQNLESIRLPESLIYIGTESFKNCLALNSITIPENVDKIGKDAFSLCPFTDIYLTTTDPEKIPEIFTGGNSFDNWGVGASFNHGHYDGWEALKGIHSGSDPDGFTWDDAVEWYYIHANGLPVLHYPKQLADKVRADISANYHAHTSDNPSLGLPTSLDMHARETAGGANVGTSGSGIYTRDGWAQFMLMKESSAKPGGDIYPKEYDDVWYTMCFPFDLTDEQLAGAFNETFNIVDFSGVEVKEANEEAGTPKKLVLHFNNVAITHYKDNNGKIYDRKLDGNGNVIREKDTDGFEYNVYISRENGREYHHAIVSSKLSTNKTKTFAPGNAPLNLIGNNDLSEVVIIDGVLAEAGHPYMVHPSIGFNDGGTNKKKCYFSGIEWLPQSKWAETFEAKKRVIDLGVAMGTIDESDPKNSTPDENNFLQAAYSKYNGQTYTFIGNATEYRADAQAAIGNEPQIPEEPVLATQGDAPNDPSAIVGARLTAADEPQAPEFVANPADDTTTYPANFQTFYNAKGGYNGSYDDSNLIWGDAILNWQLSDLVGGPHDWGTKVYSWDHGKDAFKTYFGMSSLDSFPVDEYSSYESRFNTLKALCQSYHDKLAAYAQYPTDVANYEAEHRTWQDNVDAWAAYDAAYAEWAAFDPAVAQQEYEDAKDAYEDAIEAHDAWLETAKKWMTYIPKHAYFLGRKTGQLPKYYRETADDPAEGQASTRKGGAWSQFTAIVIPNEAAVGGIEKELDGKQAQSKGFDMAFDEGFLGDVISQDEATTLIEKAQAEGAEVEYMDIVVSINGQVVRRGTTSIEGLPKGIYIINGKKYFVK